MYNAICIIGYNITMLHFIDEKRALDSEELQLLWSEANTLMHRGIAESTERVYKTAQNDFLRFCKHYNLTAMPANENTLRLYVTYSFKRGLKHSTIQVYLFGVRHMHIVNGYPNLQLTKCICIIP